MSTTVATERTVKQLLAQLSAGDITIEQVEAGFRLQHWLSAPNWKTSYPTPKEPGSFAEVYGEFMDHRIDRATYARLAAVATVSMNEAAD